MSYFDPQGRELPNPQPLEIPLAMRREQTIDEKMRSMLAAMMSREAARNGQETFEEANDFDIEDEDIDDVLTPYEVLDMRPESLPGMASDTPDPLAKPGGAEGLAPADPAPSSEVPGASSTPS